MRGFRSMWGVVLCLGLAGCAVTEQRVVHGPGAGPPGAKLVRAVHRHPLPPVSCGCGRVQPPLPPLPPSMPLVTPVPPTVTVARFFPLFHERDGVPADPLERARPDPLGVRTIDHGVLVLDDGKMVRTSAEEPESNLPRVEKITAGSDAAPPAPAATIDLPEPAPAPAASEGGAGDMPVAVEAPSGDAPTPAQPPAQALPQPAAAIPLEHVEDPSLAGRPRLAQDGTLIPRPRAAGDPAYGPDPTFPASYAADGTAPTSVPRNREVWPTRRPWRPTLLSRMIQRFRRDDGAK